MSAPSPTPDLIALLAEHARRAIDATGVTAAAVSYWDREDGTMRTLVNVGALHASEAAFPADELYPLDAFPAVAALLRFGRPYLDPPDVSSSAVLAALCHRSQAGVPIVFEGTVWGELWTASGKRALTAQDLPALSACAEAIGRMLAAVTSG
jgi:GAF domain-containing protein